MPLITDPDQLNDGVEITITTGTRKFILNSGSGNLSDDGVTLQAIYSFFKEEWKDDPNEKSLMAHPFPMVAITPEQFEFVKNWEPHNEDTRKLIRTGGWREINTDNNSKLKREYAGIITLGNFEDNLNDKAYFQIGSDPTDTSAAIDFNFNGPVNEPILTYEENVGPFVSTGVAITSNNKITRPSGSWVSDGYKIGSQITILNAENNGNNGTFTIVDVNALELTVSGTPLTNNADDTTAVFARNYRNSIKLFLRSRDGDINGKTYAQSKLSDIGVTNVDNKVFRFPLSNTADLRISSPDDTISTDSPYTDINIRYFNQPFSRSVDSSNLRNFGIVIDIGTHSGVDGSITGNTLTTTEGGIVGENYEDGILIVHEGPNKGTYNINGTPTATVVTISGSFVEDESNVSFTIQRETPVNVTVEQIYEKIQYQLRQASDIDSTNQIVTGKTADSLLSFVGDSLKAGVNIPNNPNGGGSGVMIIGFNTNDTNRLVFVDNSGIERTFPFVSAGSINFNLNLVNDPAPAKYFMFYQYTEKFTNTGFSISAVDGNNAVLTSSTTNLISELTDGNYIKLNGFTNAVNNGIYRIDSSPSGSGPWTVDIIKIDESVLINESAGASVSLEKNPIDSDDAILVNNNSGNPIAGNISLESTNFDFDYDGNVQGGRNPGSDAAIVIRAIGTDTAQFVETTGVITRNTGISFSLVAALERNYNNQ
jgi:hypothetical protein